MEEKEVVGKGWQNDQKLKAFLILNWLHKKTDKNHILNATEIADRAEKELPDKDQLILVYCRSGRRSKIAAEELVKLGYTNVKEFGGIIDWEYEIVK